MANELGTDFGSGPLAAPEGHNDSVATIPDNSITTVKLINGAVTNAKLANMAEATIKGRASGAGAGVPTDLTAAQVGVIVKQNLIPARGADLTDADVTIQPHTDKKSLYVLPAGTLTGNHALTAGVVGATAATLVFILCLDTSANVYTIKNNAGATIATHQGSVNGPRWYEIFLFGADWIISTVNFAETL